MFSRTCNLLLATMLLMLTGVGYGNQITYTATITPVDALSLAPSYDIGFSLNKFDPSLGTLTGIELNQVASILPEIQIANFSGVVQTFSASTSSSLSFSGPDGTTITTPVNYATAGTVSSAFGTTTFSPLSPDLVGSSVNVSPTNFALYQGSGTANYSITLGPLFTTSVTVGSGSGLVFAGGDQISGGDFAVSYTYTPVPEPSTLVLLGIGAVSLLAYAWRRRRN
jgi:hypothetical protein